jgi:hypothetical protein
MLMLNKSRRIVKGRVRSAVAMLILVALASAGTAALAGAFAHPHRTSAKTYNHSGFAVFSRHHSGARTATASDIPANAVLAGTSKADGQSNEVYAMERAPGEYCLLDIENVEARTVACGAKVAAEEHGLLFAEKSDEYAGTNVVGLVPNGVSTVTFTNTDGTAHVVKVTNNFVAYANAGGVASTRFTLPNGSSEERRIGN